MTLSAEISLIGDFNYLFSSLILFITLVSLIFLILTTIYWGLVDQKNFEKSFNYSVYFNHRSPNFKLDLIQKTFNCCGWNSVEDFLINKQIKLPKSCFLDAKPQVRNSACKSKVHEFLKENFFFLNNYLVIINRIFSIFKT